MNQNNCKALGGLQKRLKSEIVTELHVYTRLEWYVAKTIVLISLFIISTQVIGQSRGYGGSSEEYNYIDEFDFDYDEFEPETLVIKVDFNPQGQHSYKELRKYKLDKDDQLTQWQVKENIVESYLDELKYHQRRLKRDLKSKKNDIVSLSNILMRLPEVGEIVDWDTYDALGNLGLIKSTYFDKDVNGPKVTLQLRPGIKNKIQTKKADTMSINAEILKASDLRKRCIGTLEAIQQSLDNVKKDYREILNAIDEALAPEYKSQDFTKTVSITFAALVGLLILLFFFVIYKKSGEDADRNVVKYLLSDGGLQFITIFVLIIAIILFGILEILKGKELAAILAGISGYILGKSNKS